MTVAINDTIERFVISGVGPYAYTWRIFNETDLQVYALSTDSPPVATQLTYSGDYTVQGANQLAGGTVTLLPGAAATYAGYTIDIRANTPADQPTSIRNQGRFLPEIHEDTFDLLSRQVQDLRRLVLASTRSPDYEPQLEMLTPPVVTRAGKYAGYDANGKATVFTGTGNDSALRTDLAITVSGSDGSRLIGYRRTEAGSIARSAFSKLQEVVSVLDFGANTIPGTTNMTAAIQAAVNAAAALGVPAYLPASAGECLITSPITITSSRSGLVGDGTGKSRIKTSGCNGFTVSPGLSFITLEGFSLASAVRYTTTPNTLTGIDIQGTTASQVYYSRLDDLFIDGFQVCVAAYGVAQCSFTRIDGEFCFRGFVAEQLTLNNFMTDCWFVGAIGTSDRGIVIGDGNSAAEGWSITNCLSYGFNRAVWVRGSSTVKVHYCILDFFSEFGVLVSTGGTNAPFDVNIVGNYMAATGLTADSGIYFANAVAPSSSAGNIAAFNRILAYAGASLTNGILCDGAQESNNLILGNKIKATTFDCRFIAGAGHKFIGNTFLGPGFSSTVQVTYQGNTGTNLTVNFTSGYTIDGSAVFDPPSLADGVGTTTNVSLSGAALGDLVIPSFSLDLQGITLTAYVQAANNVSVRFQNESGGVLDLASGTLRVRVLKL